MSIMPILVPFVVLATGFATIMFLLYRNLQRLDQEAGDAWRRVQEQRAVRLDASLRLLDALDAAGELADAPTAGIRQAAALPTAAPAQRKRGSQRRRLGDPGRQVAAHHERVHAMGRGHVGHHHRRGRPINARSALTPAGAP